LRVCPEFHLQQKALSQYNVRAAAKFDYNGGQAEKYLKNRLVA
jgi:hypothetical protein